MRKLFPLQAGVWHTALGARSSLSPCEVHWKKFGNVSGDKRAGGYQQHAMPYYTHTLSTLLNTAYWNSAQINSIWGTFF